MGMIEDTHPHPTLSLKGRDLPSAAHPTLPLKGRDLVSAAQLALPLKWSKCIATQTGIDHGNQVAQQQS
jgi:hypothetical protein